MCWWVPAKNEWHTQRVSQKKVKIKRTNKGPWCTSKKEAISAQDWGCRRMCISGGTARAGGGGNQQAAWGTEQDQKGQRMDLGMDANGQETVGVWWADSPEYAVIQKAKLDSELLEGCVCRGGVNIGIFTNPESTTKLGKQEAAWIYLARWPNWQQTLFMSIIFTLRQNICCLQFYRHRVCKMWSPSKQTDHLCEECGLLPVCTPGKGVWMHGWEDMDFLELCCELLQVSGKHPGCLLLDNMSCLRNALCLLKGTIFKAQRHYACTILKDPDFEFFNEIKWNGHKPC